MRHWVQYHKPDDMGKYDPSYGDFIVMKKDLHPDPGDRAWLVSRQGRPGKYEYVLCRTFLVVSSGPNDTGLFPHIPYCVRGAKGMSFDPLPLIDKNADWFKALFQITQHFHWGFTHIKDDKIVQGLSKLAGLP